MVSARSRNRPHRSSHGALHGGTRCDLPHDHAPLDDDDDHDDDDDYQLLSQHPDIPPTRKRKSSSRLRAPLHSSDEDFQIDDPESSLDAQEDEDRLVSEEFDLQDQEAAAPRRRRRRHKVARGKKKRKAAARRIPRRSRRADTSDEDFEIDDAVSSLDGQDLDSEEELDAAAALTRSSKRARYADSNSGARQASGSQKRSTGNGIGQSMSQITKIGAEEEQATQSRSTSGFSGRSHSDVGSDKCSEKRKGKQVVVEADDTDTKKEQIEDESAAVCGVCLTEEVVERGKLDCCDHFFCFGCIMEWAKVESRCPMCKQRFVTIVRPNNTGSRRTRTIRVPLRNQVYEPPEEEEEDDPYSEIVCMECLEAGEEGLLLLCDHCDSAAHTYCVGLGRSVPRGDWFCRSCQTTMPESSGSEDEEEEVVLGFSDDDEDVSILRVIVATLQPGRHHTASQRPSSSVTRALSSAARTRPRSGGSRRRLLGRLSGRLTNRRAATRQLSQAARTMIRNTESAGHQSLHMSNREAGPARTVPQQRRLQERIQTMRDTWGRIQTGALQFTAIGSSSIAPDQTVANTGGESIVSKVEPRSSTEIASTEEKQNGSLLNSSFNSAGPPSGSGCSRHVDSEIEQAWLMMERAKSLSVGASCASVQQKLGVSQERTCIPASTGTRPAAGSTMNANAGSTSRASSSKYVRNSPDVRMKPPAVLSNSRTDYGDSIHKDSSVSNCLEIVSKTDGVRRNCFEEVEGKELSNKGNFREFSCGSGSVAPTLIANSEVHSKQQVPLRTVSSSAIRTKERVLESVLQCSGEAPGTFFEHKLETLEKAHDKIISHEKRTVTKQDSETGKLHSRCKEYRRIQNYGHGTHLFPLHVSDKGVGNIPDEEHGLAHGAKRDGRNLLDTYHDETGHTINAATSSHASVGPKRSECVKVEVAAMVKAELWPLYLSEGFDKAHFKNIARRAVHMLLDVHCSEDGKSNPNRLHCAHMELQEKSLLAGCCDNCLKLEVRKVVRTAKTKIEAG